MLSAGSVWHRWRRSSGRRDTRFEYAIRERRTAFPYFLLTFAEDTYIIRNILRGEGHRYDRAHHQPAQSAAGTGPQAGYGGAPAEGRCDSPKLVGEAVQHGVSVQCVIAADGVAFPEGLPENVRRVTVPADVMASISPMPTPQGMLALCALPDMAAPARLSPGRYVVLDGVQDPGNVGAVLRTADAFGCTGALLLPGCADPYGPKTLRAAMGAVFRLPLYAVGLETLPRLLADAGLPLYGTALRHDTVDVRQRDLRRCALVIGSEGRGVSAEVLALCRETLRIPMSPHCESLNAAAAAAVLLWEAYRAEEGN